MQLKTCHVCFDPKPLCMFKLTSKGLFTHQCDDCRAEYHRLYKARKKEELLKQK